MPAESETSPFSERVKAHPRIAHEGGIGVTPLLLAVVDQLLVCSDLFESSSMVKKWLSSLHAERLTTMLAGLGAAGEDVLLFKVNLPPHDSIFDVVRHIRGGLSGHERRGVSPNHVLIAAPAVGHICPSGPPAPAPPGVMPPALTGNLIPVTVIDTGYISDPANGPYPLDQRGSVATADVEWFDGVDWRGVDHDEPDENSDGKLDALAGHANFVAGVLAKGSQNADITIRSHSSGFDPNSDDFPTEIAVGRSLWQSQGAQVVSVGFAFTALDDTVGCVWDLAVEALGPDTMVVAPAGNQGDDHVRFPGGLKTVKTVDQGLFANVLAVGSSRERPVFGGGFHHSPPLGGTPPPPAPLAGPQRELVRSSFSNYGGWVSCAADGNDVVSTFIHVTLPVEDADPGPPAPPALAFDGWATWNGTSFATPKVAAGIVNTIAATGAVAVDAWQALEATGEADDLNHPLHTGVVFRNL